MQVPVIILTLLLFSSGASANCVTNERGRVVCDNGNEAGGYNPKTGNAWKSERNQYGSSYDTDERRRKSQNQKWQRCISHC